MRIRLIILTVLTVMFVSFFAMPALAALYRFTDTSFRHIGEVFQEKEVILNRGSTRFRVSGQGMAQGNQEVHESAAEQVYAADQQYKSSIRTSLSGLTATDAIADKKMTLMTGTWANDSYSVIGVEMQPGERGSINQESYYIDGPDGYYLEIFNKFSNSGGRTRHKLEIPGYISDDLDVVGYSEVWERTEAQSGNTRTGWWDIDIGP